MPTDPAPVPPDSDALGAARRREAATREILDVISRSRDDDRPVFDAILETVTRLCGADSAALLLGTPAGPHLTLVALRQSSGPTRAELDAFIERINREPMPMDPDLHISARAICTGKVVHIHDLADSGGYLAGEPSFRFMVEDQGVRTTLSVPIFGTHDPIGCISVHRDVVRPYSQDEIALVETFAAQAVIAIENVRQFRELRDSLEQQEATSDILRVISQSREDETRVFDLIVEKAVTLCEADQGSLVIVNEARTHVRLMVDRGHNRTAWQPGAEFSLDLPLPIMATIRTAQVVHIEDYSQSDAYRDRDPIAVRMVETEGHRTRLIVPLVQNGIAIGGISLSRRVVRPFTPDQIALVETFAAQAVIAIENVRQFRELQTRLAREAATREILEVISHSRDDDRPVFDAILRNANRLCGTSMATLMLGRPDDSFLTLAAYMNPLVESQEAIDRIIDFSNRTGMRMDASEHFSAQAILTGEVVQIADLSIDKAYLGGEPTVRIIVEDMGVRTILSVPLFDARGAMGAISLHRQEVQPFHDDEIALIRGFAAQAVIAIENVRQFRELQARLAREAATREILEVISHSRDDEKPVFDVVLRKAAELCSASMADLEIISADGSRSVMAAHWGEALRHYVVGQTAWPMESELAKALYADGGRIVHVHDLADTDLYRSGDPMRVADVEKEGIRTFLAVPMFSGGKTVGCVTLYRREVKPFTPDEIALVETFAAQAVIAIENVRQFRAVQAANAELQTRLEREAASAEILEVISQSRNDEAPVFEVILRNVARLCNTSLATLDRVNEARTHLEYAAHWGVGMKSFDLGTERMALDSTMQVAQSAREGRTIHAPDLKDTELYRQGDPIRVQLVDIEGVRSYLTVPLVSAKGDTRGCLCLYRQELRPFTLDEIALVETFAAQAVIAIENVRQFREIQTANVELQTRLAREAATREILEVISQSRDDDRPVFDAVLRNSAILCGASMASLDIVSEDRSHAVLVAHWGENTAGLVPAGRTVWRMDSEVAPATCMREGRIVHIHDMVDTALYRNREPVRVTAVETEGIRTFLAVPLISGGLPVGCIEAYRREVRPFTPDEIALLETFAAQAVIAIENVRQFRELQTRLAREAATREILEVISQSRDDDAPVFDAVLRNANRLCGTSMAYLVLGRPDDSHMTLAAYVNPHLPSEESVDQIIAFANQTRMRMDGAEHFSAQAIISGEVVQIADLASSPGYLAGEPTTRILVEDVGVRTILSVPLFDAQGAIGAISLQRREERVFSDDEITLIQSFAAQAVIAIENVRQFRALEALNAELGDRVQSQVGEIERMGRLKRFLPAAVADAVVSSGSERMLSSHRALLGVLFADIRGFTAFCETAEPEETIEVLQTYHEEMGKLIAAHGAGVDHRMGDGIMVLFNDPLPCDDPAGSAVRLALAMRERMAGLCARWKKMGHRLGFGVGISLGYATVGMVGAGGRQDYTASGTAINLASRLCDEAADGEILVSPRAATAIEGSFAVESRGERSLKGIREPVELFRVAAG